MSMFDDLPAIKNALCVKKDFKNFGIRYADYMLVDSMTPESHMKEVRKAAYRQLISPEVVDDPTGKSEFIIKYRLSKLGRLAAFG